jgi:putative transposase
VLDEPHLVSTVRYAALNPVRARLVKRAQDWAWSSARAHLAGRDDGLVRVAPLAQRIGRFRELIEETIDHQRSRSCARRRAPGGRSDRRLS